MEWKTEELFEKHHSLKVECDKRTEQVRVAQEKVFQEIFEAKWTPLEDNDVRTKLGMIESAIRQWARDYAQHGELPAETIISHVIYGNGGFRYDASLEDETALTAVVNKPWIAKFSTIAIQANLSRLVFE
ncbi:hypothetical protein FQN57_004984 [Myotisia sp. PD_48]|nr:hypothetical protein FQN57_004984 [Myotisia sp. PD_48]